MGVARYILGKRFITLIIGLFRLLWYMNGGGDTEVQVLKMPGSEQEELLR